MRLFDPDCLYASFGALEASLRAIKLWHHLGVLQASLGMTPATRMIHQEYRTTPLMSLLMGGEGGGTPSDPKTRVLLSKSSSEGTLGSGSRHDHKGQDKVPLEGWRRTALYRSANKRIENISGLVKAETAKAAQLMEKPRNTFMKSGKVVVGRKANTRSSERT